MKNNFFKKNGKALQLEIRKQLHNFTKQWQVTHPWVEDAMQRLEPFATSGKLIRGQLVVVAAQPKTPALKANALAVGSALELMHTGILMHDDIMDRDTLRRGLPTMHTQYAGLSTLPNKQEALHYGEAMASCVAIISYFVAMGQFGRITSPYVAELLQLFSQEMAILGLGQMEDVDTAIHPERASKDSVFRVYEQKTGRYTFAVPLLAGFILAGKKRRAVEKQVFALAHSLGVLFQLRDDMLGVFGDSSKTGKSVGGDIRERKQTWLYFETVQCASKTDSKKLVQLYASRKLLSTADQRWVVQLMRMCNVEEKAQNILQKEATTALKLLKTLPFGKAEHEVMAELINYLVTREK